MILFVMVGAAVDVRYTLDAGLGAVISILITAPLGAFSMDATYMKLLSKKE